VSETVELTWAQTLEARAKARGQAQGQLDALREILRDQLTGLFGPLPEDLVRQINECEDVERLRSALRRVVRIQTLEELNF
jgi:hypothetical protein